MIDMHTSNIIKCMMSIHQCNSPLFNMFDLHEVKKTADFNIFVTHSQCILPCGPSESNTFGSSRDMPEQPKVRDPQHPGPQAFRGEDDTGCQFMQCRVWDLCDLQHP